MYKKRVIFDGKNSAKYKHSILQKSFTYNGGGRVCKQKILIQEKQIKKFF